MASRCDGAGTLARAYACCMNFVASSRVALARPSTKPLVEDMLGRSDHFVRCRRRREDEEGDGNEVEVGWRREMGSRDGGASNCMEKAAATRGLAAASRRIVVKRRRPCSPSASLMRLPTNRARRHQPPGAPAQPQ